MNKEQFLEPFKRPVFIITLVLMFLLNLSSFFGNFFTPRFFGFIFLSGAIYLFYVLLGFEKYKSNTKIYKRRWFLAALFSLLILIFISPILKFFYLNHLDFFIILFDNFLISVGIFLIMVLIYDLIKSKFNKLIYILTGLSGLVALLALAVTLWIVPFHCFPAHDCEMGGLIFYASLPIFLIFGTIFVITLLKIKNRRK